MSMSTHRIYICHNYAMDFDTILCVAAKQSVKIFLNNLRTPKMSHGGQASSVQIYLGSDVMKRICFQKKTYAYEYNIT